MGKRETGNKKHKARRIAIVTLIITAVAAVGGIVATAAFATPLLLMSEICFAVAGGTLVVGLGTAANVAYSAKSKSGNRKASIKNLQKIAENDLSLSNADKRKIVKKYAKANLKLCKLIGCPLCGKYHSISGMDKEAKTEALNALENLELLQSLETTEKGRKKWDSKIKTKRKIVGTSCLRTPQRWTKTYDDFIDGISIYDRRTEIGCLSTRTTEEFARIAEVVPNTDELGASVILNFKPSSRIQSTYARVADPTFVGEVSRLMLQDVYYACEGKTEAEISAMFPFTIHSHTLDKKTSKCKEACDPHIIRSYTQLQSELGISTDTSATR